MITICKINSCIYSFCTGLTSVAIGNGITSIGECTFWECTGLTEVAIPNGVTEIGLGAFSDCTGLTEVVIPESVTKIGTIAFKGCTGLTAVTIPNRVTEIGQWAFENCTNLKSIYVYNPTPPTANNDTFDSATFSDATLYIPTGSLSAYQEADVWKEFLNIVEMDFSGVEDVLAEDVTVTIQNGAIVVTGLDEPIYIEVYNLHGQRVYCGYETTIPMNERGIYLVKIGNRVVKVVL